MKLWLYGILIIAVFTDLRDYKIPNHLIAFGLCISTIWLENTVDTLVFIEDIVKMLFFAIALLPLYHIRALGGGDIKLLVVLSLTLGIRRGTLILVTSMLAGAVAGLIKLLYVILKSKGEYFREIWLLIRQRRIPLVSRTRIHFSIYILMGTLYLLEVRG